jgi:beta-lactamase regulating signal transducer with metallopeptidase domain
MVWMDPEFHYGTREEMKARQASVVPPPDTPEWRRVKRIGFASALLVAVLIVVSVILVVVG